MKGKLDIVKTLLSSFQRVIVAYSGGVDSTLLAVLARDVLGRANALAVTADSPSLSRQELDDACRLAVQLGLWHLVIPTREVEDPAYRANTNARCYVCKQELFEELGALAAAHHIPVVAYGAIGDDLLSERPGQRAALAYQVRAPLQEAGVEKWEVRELARTLGLPNWDKPQNACLASRLPHGEDVTEEKLRHIEAAEAFFRRHGFRQVRVRHLGTRARVEVEPEAVSRLNAPPLRATMEDALHALGFTTVIIDPHGYSPGGADHQGKGDQGVPNPDPQAHNYSG